MTIPARSGSMKAWDLRRWPAAPPGRRTPTASSPCLQRILKWTAPAALLAAPGRLAAPALPRGPELVPLLEFQPSSTGHLELVLFLFCGFQYQTVGSRPGRNAAGNAFVDATGKPVESLFAATKPALTSYPLGSGVDDEALTHLLFQARRTVPSHASLSLDFPAGEMTEAIRASGIQNSTDPLMDAGIIMQLFQTILV